MNTIIKGFSRSLLLSTERTSHLLTLSRCLSTSNLVFASKAESISNKLGLPQRPKKPLTGYLRFLNEIRPTIKTPNSKAKDVLAVAVEQWKKLDEPQKEKYKAQFDKENEVFRKQLEAYEKSLTKEQKLAIKHERIRLKEVKIETAKRAEKKNRLKELGKPKHPLSAFILFFMDENSKSKTTAKATREKFLALSPSEKKPYEQKAAVLRDQYRKDLQVWHKRMEAKGLFDLIPRRSQPKLTKLTK